MSHVTDIKTKVRDLDALEEACENLGLELVRDQTTYAWWGHFVGDSHAYGEHRPEEMGTCAHAIRVKGTHPRNGSDGPWEIGVVPAKDGDGFNLYYDTYGGAGRQLTNRVEQGATALKREYAAAMATRKAKQSLGHKGFSVTRETIGRTIRLKVRKR